MIPVSPARQALFATGSMAFTLLERMLILYIPFYFLPPEELGINNLIPDRTYSGVLTVLGLAFLLGRILDALADPLIASLSDSSRARMGRRKFFLVLGGLPLFLATALVFFPPGADSESLLNGIWLGLMISLFYLAFTAYVNPYLALISELGHTDSLRINLSTLIAVFGMAGMIAVTVLFPELTGRFQETGLDFRRSYQITAVIFGGISLVFLFAATTAFNEKIHCVPIRPPETGTWDSLKQTFAIKPFRVFVTGEIFMQLSMNIITLGLMYYVVVLFQQEQRFMTVLASITMGSGLLSIPLVNMAAKKIGKKRIIQAGVLVLAFTTGIIFILSGNLTGAAYYLGLAMFGLSGVPLAILVVLVNPTIAELARADAAKTGRHREAMFFGARAIPLKLTTALAGIIFGFLLSYFGKDVANPLGVRLSLAVVPVACSLGYIFFSRYPEKEVKEQLEKYEANPPLDDLTRFHKEFSSPRK